MKWQIIDTGKNSALNNMELDRNFLENLGSLNQCILHLYEWNSDSATYGYFNQPFLHLNKQYIEDNKFDLARRPTGGGIVFHLCDFAFTFLVPATHPMYSVNTLDNYAFANRLVAAAIGRFLGRSRSPILLQEEQIPLDAHCIQFCMAKPTVNDVMLDGRKVSGGAQRRTKNGFLHQGTISLTIPTENFINGILLPGSCVLEGMKKNSFALLGPSVTVKELVSARQQMKEELIRTVNDFWE